MEYIEKKRHVEAHALIDGFLQRHKEKHGGVYQGDLYRFLGADFIYGQPKTRAALIDILSAEQHGRCCYCMRRIDNIHPQECTIEHVIVNHPETDDDYNQYLGLNTDLDMADMLPALDFIAKQLPPPPYPHSVAYENVLISCAGHCHLGVGTSFTCNNHRGHKFVHPLPLMRNVSKEIRYKSNGFVYWINETNTENPTIEALGLNYDVLKLIRRLWHKLSFMKLDALNCDRSAIIYEVLGDLLEEGTNDAIIQTLFLFAENEWYWELLCQFDYFNDLKKFE